MPVRTSARTGDPIKTCFKIVMAITTIESEAVPIGIKALLVTSQAWPVRCGRQGRAIMANQVST